MSIQYFKEFPVVQYGFTDDPDDTKGVTDITKRVGIRRDFAKYVNSYYTEDIPDGSTPEQVALDVYGSPYDHWILLHCNNVVDPYFDWVLDAQKFDIYIQKKYPDEVMVLTQTKDNYIVGETITGSISGATAIVKSCNPELGQITYESSSSTAWDTSTPDTIVGSVSNLQVTIESYGKEFAAAKFYEVVRTNSDGTEDRLIVDKGFTNAQRELLPGGINSWAAPVAVDNASFESRLNEENRKVKILQPELVELFENEFKEKIQ